MKTINVKIMKFGGSSLANGRCMLRVGNIIKNNNNKNKLVIVVSAVKGVTNKLILVFNKYKKHKIEDALKGINDLQKIHSKILKELDLPKDVENKIKQVITNIIEQLLIFFRSDRPYLSSDYDYIISFGERLSSLLLTSTLNNLNVKAEMVDSSDVIVISSVSNRIKPLLDKTQKKAFKMILPLIRKNIIPVVTGFYGASEKGDIVTLGRGGSDYSATILAHVLDAQEVILWKEIDGVFNKDPKKNCKAKYFSELTYKKATVLARNGAKVLHHEAMKPVEIKGIIVRVKNTFKPNFVGTKIWKGS